MCFLLTRLTPALAVMVLMQLSLIEHMGSGPLWDKSNKYLTQFCQENWWSALLYVQNYISDYRMVRITRKYVTNMFLKQKICNI